MFVFLKNLIYRRFCYECLNKATGERKCIICGGHRQQPGKLVLCELCPRSYHHDCYIPPMLKGKIDIGSLNLTYLFPLFQFQEASGIARIVPVRHRRRNALSESRKNWKLITLHSRWTRHMKTSHLAGKLSSFLLEFRYEEKVTRSLLSKTSSRN